MSGWFNLNFYFSEMARRKFKQTSADVQVTSGVKRKTSGDVEPPSKRQKDDEWFPGKFVLLKPPTTEEEEGNVAGSSSMQEEDKVISSASSKRNAKKKKKKLNVNGLASNGEGTAKQDQPANGTTNGKKKKKKPKKDDGKAVLDLAKLYENMSSDDDDWMDMGDSEIGDTEDSFESLSDEEVGEEWTTDTDYSECESLSDEDESFCDAHSFHESECDSVSVSDENDHEYYDDDCSSDDSDYVPEIEDKYVKPGDAVVYDAKGLDFAFGNSTKSQIIEIKDIQPAIVEKNEDEAPELIPPDDEVAMEDTIVAAPPAALVISDDAEGLLRDLQIEDDDDRLQCSQLQLAGCATFHDCKEDQGVVVKLTNTIHFHGILIIRAIANNVQVNGYKLQPQEVITTTSISRADYFLNLTPVVEGNYSRVKTLEELVKLLPHEEANNVIYDFDYKTQAIVHLQRGLPDATLEMLQNYSSHPLLPSKKMILTNSPCPSSEIILSAKFFVGSDNQKVTSFELNDQWNNLEFKADSRLLVVGGKNVGKSGLCQFVINKHIAEHKKILLIDLDIGQPICSPAQTISATLLTKPIIGPGYLSKNEPDKCLLYGDKSIMISPFKYVRSVRQLVQFCNDNPSYKNVPWVINTMGYQKGFGLQLACLLVKILQPTDIVQIQHGFKSYNFAKILTEQVVNNLEFSFFDADDAAGIPKEVFFTTHVLDSIVNNSEGDPGSKWISFATDKRKLSMLAQLSRLLKGNQSCFNDVTPFVAPISSIRMLVIDEEYSQQEQGFNMELLNGNLVYLCHSEAHQQLDSSSILACFGVGIVRGIDKINGQIFILLPQVDDVEMLQAKVNVLAISNIPMPAEILLKQSYKIAGNIPHVTFFKDRNISSKKYVNKRNIKDCF